MRKANVMIEVTDELYDTVVEPAKKGKRFGKLVVQLLEGYMTNDAIYSYINGALDGLDEKANENLLKDLNAMSDSLNMFSFLQEEAQSVVDNGAKEFSNIGKKSQNDFKEVKQEEKQVDTVSREEVESIVNEGISSLKDMLTGIMMGSQMAQQQPVVQSRPDFINTVTEEAKNVMAPTKVSEPEIKEDIVEKEITTLENQKSSVEIENISSSPASPKTEEEKAESEKEASSLLSMLTGSLGSF